MTLRSKIKNWLQTQNILLSDVDNSFESQLAYAQKGMPEMQVNVAQLYLFGIGVEKNEQQALYWLEQAEKNGGDQYGFCYYQLGRLYEYGNLKPQNYQKAIEYYQFSINKDNAFAKTELGKMYLYGKGVDINYDKAKTLFLQAESVDSYAAAELGLMYLLGKGVKTNLENAIYWLKKAAENSDDPNVYFLLASAYQEYKQHSEAIYWFQEAANQNDAQALNVLAEYFAEGIHITQNSNTAIELYTKAAELGNSSAQTSLGYHYLAGDIVPQDIKKSVYWTLKAIEKEEPFAMYNWAMFYLNGVFDVSEKEAKHWLNKVANQNENLLLKQKAEEILSELNQ